MLSLKYTFSGEFLLWRLCLYCKLRLYYLSLSTDLPIFFFFSFFFAHYIGCHDIAKQINLSKGIVTKTNIVLIVSLNWALNDNMVSHFYLNFPNHKQNETRQWQVCCRMLWLLKWAPLSIDHRNGIQFETHQLTNSLKEWHRMSNVQ